MTRRDFAATAAVSFAACSTGQSPTPGSAAPARKPVRMYVGTQRNPTTPEMLDYFKRHGVEHIAGYAPSREPWTVETLKQTREMCEQHGVTLDFVVPSGIRSRDLVAEGDAHDRAVEGMQQLVADCAEAGIPAVKYNLSFLSMQRTGSTPGPSTPKSSGNASTPSWPALCRPPTRLRCALRVIPTTPASHRKAIAGLIAFSARWTG